MQRNTLLYILGAAVLTSCADDMVNGDATEYLNGKEKTPIEVSALLDKSNGAGTRAADMKFDNGDELIAYLRHVTWNGPVAAGQPSNPRTPVTADQAPRLVTFTTTGSTTWDGEDITPIGTGVKLGMTADNTKQATDLTAQYKNTAGSTTSALYWDDFSNSVDADHDLRTDNHYLQSYYGYCYNGGEPTTALVEAVGTLGWTVATDQHEGFKTSDLLWSYEQTPIPYAHVDGNGDKNHGTLILPYTHAMSKVTIEVVCGDGFDATKENFTDASVILKNMNTVASLTAPKGTSVAVPGAENANVKDVTTLKIADGTSPNEKHSFAALIAPTTMMEGQVLAEIKLVDGNNYKVVLSDAVLNTSAANDWASKLTDYNSTAGGTTQPGVNYLITVTVNKQKILVEATIQDWEAVTATGVGVMDFSANIISSETSGTPFTTDGANFNLWRSTTNDDNAAYDEKSTEDGVNAATTMTYSGTSWSADPKIYWPNNNTPYYFRALAKYNGTNYSAFGGEDDEHAATTDLKIYQGTDLVWGTTAEHTGTKEEGGTQNYGKGAAINPRTSEVPLAFEHAMSKISVILVGETGDNPIDISGAKISIVNIYDQGTVSLKDGKIIELAASDEMPIKDFGDKNSSEANKLDQFCVIPQSLINDKGGNARTGATTFYTPNDLTKIYDNSNSSIGEGDSQTYVTSTLTAINYIEEQAKEYNASLEGAKHDGDELEAQRDYTLAEYNALGSKPHAEISEAAFNDMLPEAKVKVASRPYTIEEFRSLEIQTQEDLNRLPEDLQTKPAVNYTQAEIDAATIIAGKNVGDQKDDGVNTYTQEEIDAAKIIKDKTTNDPKEPARLYTLVEYMALDIKPHTTVTDDQFNGFTELEKTKPAEYYSLEDFKGLETLTEVQFNDLPKGLKTRAAILYTQDDADAYNAKLPGAKTTNDVHHYEKKSDSEPAEPGDIKSNGNKVVLHIMLTDKTGYTLDLSTCKDTTTDLPVTAWEPGKEYTYTITLGKEEILFRALVKEWDKKETSGNATFEWD